MCDHKRWLSFVGQAEYQLRDPLIHLLVLLHFPHPVQPIEYPTRRIRADLTRRQPWRDCSTESGYPVNPPTLTLSVAALIALGPTPGIVRTLTRPLDYGRLGRPDFGRHRTEARVGDCWMTWASASVCGWRWVVKADSPAYDYGVGQRAKAVPDKCRRKAPKSQVRLLCARHRCSGRCPPLFCSLFRAVCYLARGQAVRSTLPRSSTGRRLPGPLPRRWRPMKA